MFNEMVEICNQALGAVLVKVTLFGSSTIVSGCLPPKYAVVFYTRLLSVNGCWQ